MPTILVKCSYIIMLNELSPTARQNAAKHALAFAEAGVFTLLVLDIDTESIALKEELQVTVMLQDRVCGNLVDHALQGSASRLDKIGIEATDGLLLWRRGDNDAWVVLVQRLVQPKEIAVAARDSELGVAVAFRRRLGLH